MLVLYFYVIGHVQQTQLANSLVNFLAHVNHSSFDFDFIACVPVSAVVLSLSVEFAREK